MPLGRSTGLNYDDWFTQTPSWDVEDISGQAPLLYNEAIQLAMEERFNGLGVLNGRPTDGQGVISFRNIADQSSPARANTAQQVRDINVGDLDQWINYNIDSGSYHGNTKIADRWNSQTLSENINPGTEFSNIQPGDPMRSSWAREQYDIINRQLWFDVRTNQTNSSQVPDDEFIPETSPAIDVTRENGSEDTIPKLLGLEVFENPSRYLGAASTATILNTTATFDQSIDNNVVSVGPTNDIGQFGYNNRGRVVATRDVLPFGLTKAFDHYLFAHRPRVFHNAFSTDNFNSSLNGTFKELLSFSDSSWSGILNTVWTYVTSPNGDASNPGVGLIQALGGTAYNTGVESPLLPSESGYQIGIDIGNEFSFVIRDPITYASENGLTVEELITNGIMIVRCDVTGGFSFLDPSINPSSGVSLPAQIATPSAIP